MKLLLVPAALLMCVYFNSSAQGSCDEPDGTFFVDPGGISNLNDALATGKCYGVNRSTPGTFCYTFRFPSSGYIKRTIISHFNNCSGSTCSHTSSATSAASSCFDFPPKGCGLSAKVYDENCSFMNDGFDVGSASPCNMVPGNVYTLCITTTLSGCSKPVYICPLMDCTGGNCGCALIREIEVDHASCSCANGSVTVKVDETVCNYHFLWSNGKTTQRLTGLHAGTYTVSVTSTAASCTDVQTVTISNPDPVYATAVVDHQVSCAGGQDGAARVTVSGGTSPYSYLWSNAQTTTQINGLSSGTWIVTVTDANGCTDTANAIIHEPSPVKACVGITASTCSGGSDGIANVSASGGTPGYTYKWNIGRTTATITGLSPGSYAVTVTDANGCTVADSATITSPQVITATVQVTDIDCHGDADGTTTVNVSGGTPPFTYLWSNGGTKPQLTGLPAGSYTVSVTDAGGCVGTGSGDVIQPQNALDLVMEADAMASCSGNNDGMASATVSGGVPGYAYLWSNGQTTITATGLIAGNYSVTVSDYNGCTNVNVATVTVSQPAALSLAPSELQSTCGNSNGTAIVTPSGGTAPYTYNWVDGQTNASATGLPAGNYNVTVTDAHSCYDILNVSVSDQGGPTTSSSHTNALCFGSNEGSGTVSVSGGTSPFTYLWVDGQTTATATGLAAGNYGVTVNDANGCISTQNVTVTQPSAVSSSATSDTDVNCFGGADGSASVVATGGTPGYLYMWSDGQTTATASGFSTGKYYITISDANGCSYIDSATVG